jgi:hypothetical protein
MLFIFSLIGSFRKCIYVFEDLEHCGDLSYNIDVLCGSTMTTVPLYRFKVLSFMFPANLE